MNGSNNYSPRTIWSLTYPVLISLLMEHLIGITDTAFMGRAGATELGASAIASVYYLMLYMIGFGFSIGAEILIGRRNGAGQYRSIGAIFYQGVVMLLGIAAAIVFFSYTASPTLLRRIIASPEVYDATLAYTRLRVWGLFFSLVTCMFRAFYMGTTRTRILTLNGVVMVLSNILLNYLLIFGKLGLPAMGIAGAALGSTIAEAISALFFIVYTRLRTDYRRYELFRLSRLSPRIQAQILRVSGWTTLQYFISTGTWLFFFLAIEHLGQEPLAISNIVRNTSSFLFMIVSAFASTGTAIVSNLMGQQRAGEVMPLCGRIMRMCAWVMLPIFVFALLAPEIVMRIFTDDPALIAAAVPSIRVMLLTYLINIPAYVLFLAVSGTGNTRVAFWIEFIATLLYVAYIWLAALHLKADIALCWLSDAFYAVGLLVCSWFFLARGNWYHHRI